MGILFKPVPEMSKVHVTATSEQLRIARLIDDRQEDPDAVRVKLQKVKELCPGFADEDVLVSLQDCDNDVERAVNRLLENAEGAESQWIVQEKKKARKVISDHNGVASASGSAGKAKRRGGFSQSMSGSGNTDRSRSRHKLETEPSAEDDTGMSHQPYEDFGAPEQQWNGHRSDLNARHNRMSGDQAPRFRGRGAAAGPPGRGASRGDFHARGRGRGRGGRMGRGGTMRDDNTWDNSDWFARQQQAQRPDNMTWDNSMADTVAPSGQPNGRNDEWDSEEGGWTGTTMVFTNSTVTDAPQSEGTGQVNSGAAPSGDPVPTSDSWARRATCDLKSQLGIGPQGRVAGGPPQQSHITSGVQHAGSNQHSNVPPETDMAAVLSNLASGGLQFGSFDEHPPAQMEPTHASVIPQSLSAAVPRDAPIMVNGQHQQSRGPPHGDVMVSSALETSQRLSIASDTTSNKPTGPPSVVSELSPHQLSSGGGPMPMSFHQTTMSKPMTTQSQMQQQQQQQQQVQHLQALQAQMLQAPPPQLTSFAAPPQLPVMPGFPSNLLGQLSTFRPEDIQAAMLSQNVFPVDQTLQHLLPPSALTSSRGDLGSANLVTVSDSSKQQQPGQRSGDSSSTGLSWTSGNTSAAQWSTAGNTPGAPPGLTPSISNAQTAQAFIGQTQQAPYNFYNMAAAAAANPAAAGQYLLSQAPTSLTNFAQQQPQHMKNAYALQTDHQSILSQPTGYEDLSQDLSRLGVTQQTNAAKGALASLGLGGAVSTASNMSDQQHKQTHQIHGFTGSKLYTADSHHQQFAKHQQQQQGATATPPPFPGFLQQQTPMFATLPMAPPLMQQFQQQPQHMQAQHQHPSPLAGDGLGMSHSVKNAHGQHKPGLAGAAPKSMGQQFYSSQANWGN